MATRAAQGNGAREQRLTIARTWNDEPVRPEEAVAVVLSVDDDELRVTVDAPFHGDPAPTSPAGSTDRLWEHEVVEIFLLGEEDRYLELELGPHGHFLLLSLHGERRAVESGLPVRYDATIAGSRWQGEARLQAALLPPGLDRLNAFAIHGQGADRRYLAWRPTLGEQPDFHHLASFGRLVPGLVRRC